MSSAQRTAAARKIQRIFRSKRVFTENSGIKSRNSAAEARALSALRANVRSRLEKERQARNERAKKGEQYGFLYEPESPVRESDVNAALKGKELSVVSVGSSIRLSKSKITSFMTTVDAHVDIPTIFTHAPVGFREVYGYHAIAKGWNPQIRYHEGKWIGNPTQINYVFAKRGKLALRMTTKEISISGSGNLEEIAMALNKCYLNGWITAANRNKPYQIKSINGTFKVNRKINLEVLAKLLEGSSFLAEKPSLRSGKVEALSESPNGGGANERSPNIGEGNWGLGFGERPEPMYVPEKKKRTKALRKTLKSLVLRFKKPKFTYTIFENGTVLFTGLKKSEDLEVPKEFFKQFFAVPGSSNAVFGNVVTKRGETNRERLARRYPSAGTWNKLVNPIPSAYYIRPGPNNKPRLYPYAFFTQLEQGPMILNSKANLKSVYTKVKKAFDKVGKPIPAHTLKVFRNAGYPLNNASAENKKKYANTANRRAPSWNAEKPGFYVRPGPGKQPYWAAVPAGLAAGRKTVIKKYAEAGKNIPAAVRKIFSIGSNVVTATNGPKHNLSVNAGVLKINGREWTRLTQPELLAIARNLGIAGASNTTGKSNIAGMIQTKAKGKAPVVIPVMARPPPAPSPSNSNSSSLNNFGKELEYGLRLQANLGNAYQNGNEGLFMVKYRGLPSGSRGNPLKANTNKAYKQFVKNVKELRGIKNAKKPRAPVNQTVYNVYNIPRSAANFSNQLERRGLNSARKNGWSWTEVRSALKGKNLSAAEVKKIKNSWDKNVVAKTTRKTIRKRKL
jgi:TATA-box binding protein (TBP) (component of TFIID and TFIIIB)